jgi:Lon-like protease
LVERSLPQAEAACKRVVQVRSPPDRQPTPSILVFVRRVLSPARLGLAGLFLLAVAGVALLLAPGGGSYIFLPDRAHPVAPLITVEGVEREEPAEEAETPPGIYFVDVIVRRASLLERLYPGIREGAMLVPEHAVNPTGIPDRERRQGSLRLMSRSQRVAAAVALRHVGHEVEARPTGAFVSQVLADGPAARRVHAADVIVSVGGERVRTLAELREAIGAAGIGAELEIGLRRGDEDLSVTITTVESRTEEGRPMIGVLVEQEADIELPLDVQIDAGNVGGPSAGLAFALQLVEELGEEVTRGLRIAVTGEIDLDGTVSAVGGLPQKTIGARRTGVDAFVVPAGDNAEQARRFAGGLRIIAVSSFQQALQELATLAEELDEE